MTAMARWRQMVATASFALFTVFAGWRISDWKLRYNIVVDGEKLICWSREIDEVT